MKKKTRCYIYTRVSTAIQVDGYSLDAQKDKLRKYAEFQDMEIVGEYSDEGHSGKNIKGRQEFMRMLNDIEDGKDGVDFVLVFKLSRFGRNAVDVLSSLQLMQDYGVNLICVEDGIDSSKEAGKLLISIIAAVAEMERENIRVQTMAGREQKAREGKWNGGFAPYGYKLENGELVIAEDEVEIIQMIFDRYIHTNDGINGVANYLNNHGYTKKLRQNGTIPGFSSGFIKKIIDNPVYMGKIAYGRSYYCKNTVNATGHKCTFRCNIEQSQIDDVLAKLITAMTREGKFKDAIQDRIGATVDTSDLEKQLSVLNANLHQAEIIKTRLEQQMDNLDVTDIHYDKKISDLQRRLDTQYDKIDEVEEAIADLKSQVYELKKNQIDADSIYGFLNAFNELYAECTDAEKKQFMQAFIERIDIFPERREDGNWIRNIKFQFPVPVLRDGKEVVRVDSISLDKEQSGEHTVTLEKFPTDETVVKLSLKKDTPKIKVTMEPDEESNYTPEEKATYQKIKDYVKDKYGVNVHTSYIAQVKRMCGLDMGENYNKSKKENPEVKQCPQEKVEYIKDALKHFGLINKNI